MANQPIPESVAKLRKTGHVNKLIACFVTIF